VEAIVGVILNESINMPTLNYLVANGATQLDSEDLVTWGHYTAYINNYGYVCLYLGKQKKKLLHRLLMGEPLLDVDHVNRIRTDNRRRNLRVASRTHNLINSKLAPTNTTGYKGVCWVPARNKFKASISIDNKSQHLGYFDTAEKAASIYLRYAKLLYGDFATDGNPT